MDCEVKLIDDIKQNIFMAWNNDLGKRGEDIACAYLEEHGLFVLNRNWHCNKLEIDIIARKPDENLLHIVEVKE